MLSRYIYEERVSIAFQNVRRQTTLRNLKYVHTRKEQSIFRARFRMFVPVVFFIWDRVFRV